MFTLRIVRTVRMDREMRQRFARFDYSLAKIREATEMITQQLQDALDRIRQTQSLAHSSAEALRLQASQISTLTDKVTDLQKKLDAGGQISADDLGAISEITSLIDTTNAELQSAVPANTVPANTQGQSGSSGVGQQGSTVQGNQNTGVIEPGPSDLNQSPEPTQEEIDARGKEAAETTAKPLPGTGQ